jgi:4-aminobutyrate aminotransferase-like enzyme
MIELGASLPVLRTAVPGPRGEAYVEILARTECPAFTARRARRARESGASHDPIVWCEAVGANVVDADGNVFVDLTAGFGASVLGHRHPRIVEAIARQSGRLVHALGDVHPSEPKIALLDALARIAPFEGARTLLSLSGADAVESALKTAVLHTGRPGVLALEGGYHGLAHGPLSVCGYSEAFRRPFAAQLNPETHFIPFPIDDTDASLARAGEVLRDRPIGALLVEPILGRGGTRVPPRGFLAQLAALAREAGAVVIADEIYTGLGRTGTLFQCTAQGLSPDLLCLGKALGGGLPISACVGREEVMAAWGDPRGEAIHTGTFFGHPLGCATALATLDAIETLGLAKRAADVGARFRDALTARTGLEVRGAGLFLAVELGTPGSALSMVRALLERGFLVLPSGIDASALGLTPPLTIEERLLDAFVDALGDALESAS